jgi:hypothetical protein
MPSCPVIRGPSSGRAVMMRVIERKGLKMCRIRREQCGKRNREQLREKGKSGETSTKIQPTTHPCSAVTAGRDKGNLSNRIVSLYKVTQHNLFL